MQPSVAYEVVSQDHLLMAAALEMMCVALRVHDGRTRHRVAFCLHRGVAEGQGAHATTKSEIS
jgi:hypothetical protein